MAGPFDLTGQNIENTYQRVLQTPDGVAFYDGTGSLVTLPSANTASLLTTASAALNVITFTKGDTSQFSITVDTGSGGPSTPTFPYTGSAIISGSLTITGSIYTTAGLTGSLYGTASWAETSSQALTASYINPLNQNVIITGSVYFGDPVTPAFNSTFYTSSIIPGDYILYSLPTSSYDGFWFEYTVKSGSNARAGQMTGIWIGNDVKYTETATTDFGITTDISFMSTIIGGNMIISSSVITNGWTIKGIIRSI